MPLVVADTGIVMPGLLDRDSLSRKLLTVFQYGRIVARVGEAREEYQHALELADQEDGELNHELYQRVIEQAEERATAARELLGDDCPDDLVLVTSTPLLDELVHVLTSDRLKFGPVSDEEALRFRQLALRMAFRAVPDESFPTELPDYTDGRDRDDDMVVHTALEGRADIILSRDSDLVPNYRRAEPYSQDSTGAFTEAKKRRLFIQDHIAPFDLQMIQGNQMDALLRLVSVRLPLDEEPAT